MEILLLAQKTLASLFIILMSILLLFWCLPEGYFFRDLLHRRFGKFIRRAGLDNYWALFAPQPVSRNFLLGFELEFADGRVQPWKLPGFTLRNGYQWAAHIRLIKLHNQWLSQKDPAPKEAICRYIARAFQEAHPGEEAPVRVHILRFYEPDRLPPALELPWLSKRAYTWDRLPQNEAAP